jgi:energy-coupling factor transport system permease protein
VTSGSRKASAAAYLRRVPAVVWLLWALAAAATVQLAPNPLYVAVVVAIAALVVQAHARDTPLASAFPMLLTVGVTFALIRLLLTVLTAHGTGGAVLVTLPHATLPRLLGGFTVGGGVELPVLARAAAEGWAIVGIVAAFAAFNAVVSHHELVQAAPRAFYELGLAVTVALAFVPSTVAAVRNVREADRARTGGVAIRRGRLVRHVVPVLESGMERAVRLAESMDSRGFGRDATQSETAAGWCGLGSIVLLAGCFIALVARARGTALALAALGFASLIAAVVLTSRASRRARYRRRHVEPSEWAFAACAWVAPAGVILASMVGDRSLTWPGDVLTLPSVSLLPLLALAALAVPALVKPR